MSALNLLTCSLPVRKPYSGVAWLRLWIRRRTFDTSWRDDQVSTQERFHLKKKHWIEGLNTVGIWIPDKSGIQMVQKCPAVTWFGFRMVVWKLDKNVFLWSKMSNFWMVCPQRTHSIGSLFLTKEDQIFGRQFNALITNPQKRSSSLPQHTFSMGLPNHMIRPFENWSKKCLKSPLFEFQVFRCLL